MATIFSHFLVGWGVYRFADSGIAAGCLGPVVAGTLAVLPDVDALFMPWIPYDAPWGHRGLTHSLAFAAVAGIAAALYVRSRAAFPSGFAGLAATFAAAAASHGLLDAMTDGGLGVAFFAPFDPTRYFLPIRAIPVSPIGVSSRVLNVLLWETVLLWPWALLLAVIGRPVRPAARWGAIVAAAISAATWVARCV